jgi:hypothetical protein
MIRYSQESVEFSAGPEPLEENVNSEYCGTFLRDILIPFLQASNIFSTDGAQLQAANALLASAASLVDMCINHCKYILWGSLNDHVCNNCIQSFVNL